MGVLIEERSAGAIIYHQGDGRLEYLLLHYPAGHWDFPKGNIEKGEDERETVRREVKEETGIDEVEIVSGFREKIEYYYRRNDTLVRKQVIFYLAHSKTKQVTLSYEHTGFSWFGYKEALKKITYENSRRVLSEADGFMKSAGGSTSLDAFLQPRRGDQGS